LSFAPASSTRAAAAAAAAAAAGAGPAPTASAGHVFYSVAASAVSRLIGSGAATLAATVLVRTGVTQ